MNKRTVIIIHIFIWLFAIFANLPYAGIIRKIQWPEFISYAFAFLYLMLAFYFFYLFIVPVFLDKKRLILFFAVSLLTVFIMPFFGYVMLFLIRALFEGSFANFFHGYNFRMHMSGFFPVVTAAVFGSFFRIMINWLNEMNRITESEKQRLSIELELLRSKLNPHFLFNTLNNIDSLIRQDPEEASASLVRLSGIMRYLTYETVSGRVKLEQEMEYIRNFVELFRIRLKSPDDILLTVKGDLNVEISPALFLPLLENAFKYARFGKYTPSVTIEIGSHNGIIRFTTSNEYDPVRLPKDNPHSGFGLENLKKRVELTYPGKYRLNVDKGETRFFVELIIDTHAN